MRFRLPSRSHRLLTALVLVLAVVAGTFGSAGSAQARPGRSSYIVLTPGDQGSRVVALQRHLNVRPVSGYYGSSTRRAVVRWQANHQRRRTGLVGKLLWRSVAHRAPRANRPSRGGSRVSGLNWRALARCESGGNPRAVNPAGYYGLYQFSPATWRSVGGRGMPSRASAGQQTARAHTLFLRSGASPWPVCGRLLFS